MTDNDFPLKGEHAERVCFAVREDGDPLGPNEPIPEPMVWEE